MVRQKIIGLKSEVKAGFLYKIKAKNLRINQAKKKINGSTATVAAAFAADRFALLAAFGGETLGLAQGLAPSLLFAPARGNPEIGTPIPRINILGTEIFRFFNPTYPNFKTI